MKQTNAFDALRSHLDNYPNTFNTTNHYSTQHKWGERLIDLCRRAHALDPNTYNDGWKPHLSDIAETLPVPLGVVSREKFERIAALLPGALFELEFYNEYIPEGSLTSLIESSALSQVCTLRIDRTWVSNTLIPLLESPYLTGLTSLNTCEVNLKPQYLHQIDQSPLSTQLTNWTIADESFHEAGTAAFLEMSLPNLTSLTLRKVGFPDAEWKALANSKLMGQLNAFYMSSNWRLRADAALVIAESPQTQNLTELYIYDGHIGHEGLMALSRSPHLHNLTALGFSSARLEGGPFDALATSEAFPNLRTLSLNSNPLRADEITALVSGPLLAHVTSLGLARTYVFDEGLQALAASPHIANLERLDLSKCNISPAGVRALANSPHMASLTSLNLSDTNVGADGVRAIAHSPHMASLASLDLSDTNVGAEGAMALAESPYLSSLTSVNLNGADIGDEGFAALVTSINAGRLPKLAHLRLYDNNIGPEGMRALTRITGESPLESLMLTKNQIGDDGAVALFTANLPNFRSAMLISADIGDAGAKALAASKLPRLEEVSLRLNNVTDEGAMAIATSPLLADKLIQLGLSGHSFAKETIMAFGRSALFANLTTFDLWSTYTDAMLRELINDPDISPWLRERWTYILSLRDDNV